MASKKEFVEFKKKFLKYQEKFGLMGWQVYFEHKEMGDYADITVIAEDRVATVALPTGKAHGGEVMKSAKHEAMHLLMGIYCHVAHDRYARGTEIQQAEEEIVRKLCNLIPDI